MPDQPQDSGKKPVVPPPSEQTPVVGPNKPNLPVLPPSEFRLQPLSDGAILQPPSGGLAPQRTNEVSRFAPPQTGRYYAEENPPPPPPQPFFPELAPKPVTPAQAQQIFERLAAMPDIAFGFAKDGCYARAHLMATRLIEMGQTPSKAWGFEGDHGTLLIQARNGAKTRWWYHVAPTLPVEMPDGTVQQMVMDPSMFDGPATLQRWGDMMKAPPERVSVRGLNEQLPVHDGDYAPGTRTTPATTANAEQTMQEYLQQQKPGPHSVYACDLNGCVNMSLLSPEERAIVSHQPARQFEIQTGLKGIAGEYTLPDGMNAAQFEDHFHWQFLNDRTVPPPALVEKGFIPPQPLSPKLTLDVLNTAPSEVGQFYRQTWDHLVELNPALKDVKLDRANLVEVNHAIFGVSSGFNAPDINFYLERNRGDVSPKGYFEDPRFKWIAAESGAHPEWIAAPETLNSITEQLAAKKGIPALNIDAARASGIGNAGAASIGLVMGGIGLKSAIERGDTVGGAIAGTNIVTSAMQATEGIAAAAGKTIPALTSAGKFLPVVNIAVTAVDVAYQISKEDTTQHKVERGAVAATTATTGILLGTAAASTGEAAAITTVVTGALGTGVAGTGAAAITVAAAPVVLTVAAVTAVAITGDAALKAKRAWDDVDDQIAQNGAAQKREGYKADDGKPSVLGYQHIATALRNHSENMKNENMNGTGALERDARGRFKIGDFKKIDLRDPKNIAELERVLQAGIKKQDEILTTNSSFLDNVLPKWMAHGGDTLDKIAMAQMERADLAGAMQELQMYKKELKDWDAAHPDSPATTGVKPVTPPSAQGPKPRP
ncbi:MAG: hypothetical protein EPN97_02285 [Alphaproteobacteria bacterium]|nr:MAG: hypothetical protein EPN97_02285 [Alphaproteobacteria bacterium]